MENVEQASPCLTHTSSPGEMACRSCSMQGKIRVGLAVWEGFMEEDAPAGGAGLRHADGWLCQARHLTSQPLGFLWGGGGAGSRQRGRRQSKNKTPGRRFTSDLRQGKCLLIHS